MSTEEGRGQQVSAQQHPGRDGAARQDAVQGDAVQGDAAQDAGTGQWVSGGEGPPAEHARTGESVPGILDIRVPTDQDMRALGERLARDLLPGDFVLLSGELGAGKTTLVQGIGAGLGVRGPVTSPTFVIVRVHPPSADGITLVHADAYRLGGAAEIDDLDLDTPAENAVTVVEWGEGLVEDLADERLEVSIVLGEGEERLVRLTAVGGRWLRELRLLAAEL